MAAINGVEFRDDEDIIHDFRQSRKAYLFWYLTVVLAWIPWSIRKGERYVVTDERIIRFRGTIGMQTKELRLKDIREVNTNGGWTSRFTGVGTVKIESFDGGSMKIKNTPKYKKVANTIRNNIDE